MSLHSLFALILVVATAAPSARAAQGDPTEAEMLAQDAQQTAVYASQAKPIADCGDNLGEAFKSGYGGARSGRRYVAAPSKSADSPAKNPNSVSNPARYACAEFGAAGTTPDYGSKHWCCLQGALQGSDEVMELAKKAIDANKAGEQADVLLSPDCAKEYASGQNSRKELSGDSPMCFVDLWYRASVGCYDLGFLAKQRELSDNQLQQALQPEAQFASNAKDGKPAADSSSTSTAPTEGLRSSGTLQALAGRI
jgi:hypothetical protein